MTSMRPALPMAVAALASSTTVPPITTMPLASTPATDMAEMAIFPDCAAPPLSMTAVVSLPLTTTLRPLMAMLPPAIVWLRVEISLSGLAPRIDSPGGGTPKVAPAFAPNCTSATSLPRPLIVMRPASA